MAAKTAFVQAGGQLAVDNKLHLCPPDTNAFTLFVTAVWQIAMHFAKPCVINSPSPLTYA
jgi:hypothetical protein